MGQNFSPKLKNAIIIICFCVYIVFVGTISHLTGGRHSEFFQLFIIPIIFATFYFSKKVMIITSCVPIAFVIVEFLLEPVFKIRVPSTGSKFYIINVVILTIVIITSYFLLRKREKDKRELADVMQTLKSTDDNQKDAIMELIESERKLRLEQKEAEVRNAELEMTKKSMLNLLEDLDAERTVIEIERNRFESVLQSVGEGIMMVDQDGRAVLINKSFEKMFHIPKSALLNKDPSTYIEMAKGFFKNEEAYKLWTEEAFSKSIARNEEWETTFNPPKYVRRFTTPVKGSYNTRIGRIWTFRDVTRDKEIDEMRSQFVSLASHQLRTPLSAIRWFLEMVVNEEVGKLNLKQKDLLEKAYQSTSRLSDLVNALLNISRIESGRIAIVPIPTNLVELVETVILELRPMIIVKKHKLIEEYEKNLPLINLDQKLVNAAVSNLVSNAVKYTPASGKIEIKVRKEGKNAIVSVKDTGIGIPKKDYPQVFEKFYRSDKAVTSETEGTGLGLYVVKAVIESSGGEVWFRSTEGKGTTFYLSIPLKGSKEKKGEKTLA